MFSNLALPCVVCNRQLTTAFENVITQPNDGLSCVASGNYGSRVFDPIGVNESLHFNICDDCMLEKSRLGYIEVRTEITAETFKNGREYFFEDDLS